MTNAQLEVREYLDLGLLVGCVVRRCCCRRGRGRDGLGPLEGDWLDGQDVNVIESKFRRAVVRRKGGLEVAHNEQFLPLYELLDSPTVTLGLLDRELLQIAGRGHLGNGRRVEVLLEDRRLEEGLVLIVLREVW